MIDHTEKALADWYSLTDYQKRYLLDQCSQHAAHFANLGRETFYTPIPADLTTGMFALQPSEPPPMPQRACFKLQKFRDKSIKPIFTGIE